MKNQVSKITLGTVPKDYKNFGLTLDIEEF